MKTVAVPQPLAVYYLLATCDNRGRRADCSMGPPFNGIRGCATCTHKHRLAFNYFRIPLMYLLSTYAPYTFTRNCVLNILLLSM